MQSVELRNCISCGKSIRGRTDKKFCDDYCRNVFNNQLRTDSNIHVRKVNNILLKNRRILEKLLPGPMNITKASREKLLQLGFHFQYFTNTYTHHQGGNYFFCYDYGYRPLQHNLYLIVKRKDAGYAPDTGKM